MNTLKHILSGVIWSLAALYFTVMTLTHLPLVQTHLASKVAREVSMKLGTRVTVNRVNLGFLNRIIIDDVIIFDQRNECMLRIGRLSVKADWLSLLQGHVNISSAQLFGAHGNFYKSSANSQPNFQFVLDSLASNDTTSRSSINLRINSLIIRRSSLSYRQTNAPSLNRFDTKHLFFNNISSHIILKHFSEDSLNINVKRISFREESGLQLKSLAFKIEAGTKGGILSGFSLQMPKSSLLIDSVIASYNPKRWKETLRYSVDGISLKMTLSDIGFLVPSLHDQNEVVSCTTSGSGTYDSFRIPWINVSSTGNLISLKGKVWATNMTQDYPVSQSIINQLSIGEPLLRLLSREIEGIPSFANNLGWLSLQGKFESDERGSLHVISKVQSSTGDLDISLNMNNNNHFDGSLTTSSIDLKTLLDNTDLGEVAAKVDFTGDSSHLNVNGIVPKIDYNTYSYNNTDISLSLLGNNLLKGDFTDLAATGRLKINDEHLKANLNGEWEKTGHIQKIKVDGSVSDFSPKILNLTNQWGESVFAVNFSSNISASNLNDAQGNIRLYDFSMVTDTTETLKIENISLSSGFDADRHFLHLDGDMGSIALTGQFDWATLPQSFANIVGSRLPTLPGLPPLNHRVTNNFDISLHLKNTEWLHQLLGIPLTLSQPLTLQASIDDKKHEINVSGSMPSFQYKGADYQNALIEITSPHDSILCNLSLKKIMDDDTGMDLGLKANAADNQLMSCIVWDNHATGREHMQGSLNSNTQLYTDEKGKAEAHIHIQPSHTTLGESTWNIVPSDIFYSEKSLIVENFSIEHRQQHLTIDGIASVSPYDTLKVDLKEMNVGYILDLVNFHPVEFDGSATGKFYATSVFGTPEAWTALQVDSFMFENGPMGTLHAHSRWNNELKQIDINATAYDGPDAETIINGYVSPVREDISLDIKAQGTRIDFLKSYTKSVLRNIKGHAYGDVRLVGPLGEMNLLGTLIVDGQTDVIALGTTYTLRRDTVHFVHNNIEFNKISAYDKYGNTAFVTGAIHHDHLSDMTFDINIETEKLLAYDFSDYGDELFCGSVIASGKVDLHNRSGETVININATPLPSTTFSYNASSSGNVSSQEFITWRDPKEQSARILNGEKKQAATTSSQQELPSDLFLNFRINATPDATVRLLMDSKTGDYITLNGTGMIRASYHNNGAFQMFGTYQVERGTYGITIQNIIKKNFKFNEGGTIVFGGNPMDANLQLQAVHTVNGVSLSDLNLGNSFSSNTVRVNCLMNILGQVNSPRIEFDLDIPNVNSEEKQMIRSVIASEQEMNQQVLYLLGIGRFYTQDINNASSQTYDPTQLAMQSFLSGTLSSQINEVISHVVKNDNWNFGANISTGNEGWHNAEYEGIVSGRMLNNRLLINGQFGYRDNATKANPSFIGDFDIRYLLLPNGNLALKVYNQTNDRYFTHSSLNTQGIGIIIKRDFDGLGDLFFHRRKK